MIVLSLILALLVDPTVGSSTPAPASFMPASLALEPASTSTPSDAPMLQSVAVTLECTAFADGHVGACKVLDETHPGLGFGEAAIALMRDATVDRSSTDHQFARTIQFMP